LPALSVVGTADRVNDGGGDGFGARRIPDVRREWDQLETKGHVTWCPPRLVVAQIFGPPLYFST
jgi:hypothetical protein